MLPVRRVQRIRRSLPLPRRLRWARLSLALCGSADDAPSFPKGEPGDDRSCQCSDGWDGPQLQRLPNDAACANFLLGGERLGENGTCYDGGATIQQSFQQCDVTNQKIVDMLPAARPR